MNEIIPGILENSQTKVEQKLEMLKPLVKTVHIVLIDGVFAPNKTILDTSYLSAYKDNFIFEAHLMVENPERYLKPLAKSGFKRFLGHIEKMPDQKSFVREGRNFGEVGLFLDGPTPLREITISLAELDVLGVFMAQNVGFSGQSFEDEKLVKIEEIKRKKIINYKGLSLPIEVDGGINQTSLIKTKNAGATRFVCTSALFGADDLKKSLKKLQALI